MIKKNNLNKKILNDFNEDENANQYNKRELDLVFFNVPSLDASNDDAQLLLFNKLFKDRAKDNYKCFKTIKVSQDNLKKYCSTRKKIAYCDFKHERIEKSQDRVCSQIFKEYTSGKIPTISDKKIIKSISSRNSEILLNSIKQSYCMSPELNQCIIQSVFLLDIENSDTISKEVNKKYEEQRKINKNKNLSSILYPEFYQCTHEFVGNDTTSDLTTYENLVKQSSKFFCKLLSGVSNKGVLINKQDINQLGKCFTYCKRHYPNKFIDMVHSSIIEQVITILACSYNNTIKIHRIKVKIFYKLCCMIENNSNCKNFVKIIIDSEDFKGNDNFYKDFFHLHQNKNHKNKGSICVSKR